MYLILPTCGLHQIPAHGGKERTFHLNKSLLFCQDRAKGVDHSFSCAVTITDAAPFPARGHKRLHIMKDSSSRLSPSVQPFYFIFSLYLNQDNFSCNNMSNFFFSTGAFR